MIFIFLLISLSVFTLISVYNLFTAPVLRKYNSQLTDQKLVSVLIPARNEEKNIVKCIEGVLAQNCKNKEIIILDDNSNDKTYLLASSFVKENLKLLSGTELPSGWLGKNWACHQLALEAKGEYLLFLDSDVELRPELISLAVYELEKSNSSLLSIFPTQIIKTFGEHLIVPLMNWLLLTFLPLNFVHSSTSKSFIAANGQFMLWKKDDYQRLGGHNKVKNKVVEDMELARLAKQNQLKVKTMLGGELIYCRMYNSFKESYIGFQKNFYAGFSVHPFLFLTIILFLLIVFIIPFFFISKNLFSLLPLLLLIVSRLCITIKSRQSVILNIVLHPAQMLFMFIIGIISMIKFQTNQLVWKQRKF